MPDNPTAANHMLRTLTVTVLATVIVALGTAVIMQGREPVKQQVRLDNLTEKISALTTRVEQLSNCLQR